MPSTTQLLVALALSSVITAEPDSKTWDLAYSDCPIQCSVSTSSTPGQWSAYRGFESLAFCNKTMLLDFSLYNESPFVSVHECQVSIDQQESAETSTNALDKSYSNVYSDEKIKFEVGWWGDATSKISEGTKQALNQLKASVLNSHSNASKAEFAYSGGSIAGIFVGSDVEPSDASTNVLQKFIDDIDTNHMPHQILFQYCGTDSSRGLGLVIDNTGNFTGVRQIMRGWDESTCAGGFDGTRDISQSVKMKKLPQITTSTPTSSPNHQGTSKRHNSLHHKSLHRRSTCKTIQAQGGDTCGGLASKCGISLADFYKLNPDKSRCSPLIVGSYFCCDTGDLPDLSPKPNPDGTCASYNVQRLDECSKLAAANDITVEDIENYNKNTWGWTGCGDMQAKLNICLSSGDPPMPAPYGNAVCGPQVNGTKRPAEGTTLADLNPCPLNACCDVWGQCGITSDFCTKTNSTTGAPGTAKNGTNGCISNCGTDIVNNDDAPSEFLSVGYFEAFDQQRECLNMDVTTFDTDTYSHLHFAFAGITTDYDINITAVQDQFDKLKTLSGIKRVLSFGGWSFSTDADSFPIFRKGVSDANRELFATNAANFIVENDLDGIDFDWEYPGAPDIPGIPAGDKGDGDRYLEFLKLVRKNLPGNKSLSLAVPASFWYLKGFPIGNISDTVDYIVYMTYDLHGQWDFGHEYPDPGCKSGACLRSHVNLTETTSALSMITKAGVPGSKVVVGMASYGRSFEMTEAGCTGPNCEYTGPQSGATPGRCTKTAGYIANAEINEIIDNNDSAEKSFDKGSDSNILVYNKTQWVAYMDDTTKNTRTSYYKGLNLGGTVDWAVDLQSVDNDSSVSGGSPLDQQIFYVDPSVWENPNPAMNCEAPCVLVLPPWPLPTSVVYHRPDHVTTLDVAWNTTIDVTGTNGDVTPTPTITHILHKTTITGNPVTVAELPMANVNITVPINGTGNLTFIPIPRLPEQVITITDDPNPLSQSGVTHPPVTRNVTLPPWPHVTNLYIPEDVENGEDTDEDDDKNDEGSGSDNDNDQFPKIPKVIVTHGKGGPGPCKAGCGTICTGRFCGSIGGSSGGGGSSSPDFGPDFPDPIDPDPPADPNDPDETEAGDPDDPDDHTTITSCTASSTVTDYWVSCATSGTSSTSCTTTSSIVEVGCDITAVTSTTGVPVCYPLDPYEDQGQDGAPGATPTYSVTTVSVTSAPKTTTTADDTTTTTDHSTTSTGPSETSLSNTSPDESSYTCKGSSICSSFSPIKGFCDSAKARLNGDTLYGTLDSDQDTGACYTDGRNAGRGCGIFIKGDGCQIEGSVMQAAYDHLHNSDVGGCKKCGAVTFSNGCIMKVDYVTSCGTSNGPAQPITISDNTNSPSSTSSLSGLFSYDSTNDWAVVGKGPDRGRSRTGTTSKATLSSTST